MEYTDWTIVIIEDNIGLNMLIKLELEKQGFKTICITSGVGAIEHIKNNLVDNLFYLIDYKLSDMKAEEVIKHIIEKDKNIPFIIVTGEGDQQIAVEMMQLGAYDYIIKQSATHKIIPPKVMNSINKYILKIELEKSQQAIIINEHKYRSIFENIQDIYFEVTYDGMILEVSPEIENILYYTREELINKQIDILINKEQFEILVNSVQQNTKISNYVIVIKTKDQKKRECIINCKVALYWKTNNSIIVGTIRDITEQKKMERSLLIKVAETEEHERKRFSEDLHDGLGPILSAIKMHLEIMQSDNFKNAKKRKEVYDNAFEMIAESITYTKTIAHGLMPNILNDYGLITGLNSFITKINSTNTVDIKFTENLKKHRLNTHLDVLLYRTVVEFINNSLKYAKANHIEIDITKVDNIITIGYLDDGIGFNIDAIINSPESTNGSGIYNCVNRLKSFNCTIDFDTKDRTKIVIIVDTEHFN